MKRFIKITAILCVVLAVIVLSLLAIWKTAEYIIVENGRKNSTGAEK